MLADRVLQMAASPTMMVAAEAKKLKAEGVDVIDLSMGEPDFHTPNNIKEAGKDGIDENRTKYTINSGTVELRTAIMAKFKRENGLDYQLNEIIVSNGAKQSVFNAVMTVVNPGDEVIIPAPYWVSYPAMVHLAQGSSVYIEASQENGFKITPDQLKKALTDKTKLIILCNPSNPTGSAYNERELLQLAEVLRESNCYILSDEIYEKMVYQDFEFKSFASVAPDLRKRIILVNGISKAYSMTGWRIGYASANENIVAGMNKIQSHSTSHASSISQAAAIEALAGPQYVIDEMKDTLIKRREYFYDALTSIKGISCYKPEGAFYLFPNVSAYFNKHTDVLDVKNSFDFSMHLLYEAHIAVVPGSAFGKEGHVRMSYATSTENLKEAIYRMKNVLGHLHT